jgi:hypothetical protein
MSHASVSPTQTPSILNNDTHLTKFSFSINFAVAFTEWIKYACFVTFLSVHYDDIQNISPFFIIDPGICDCDSCNIGTVTF